MTNAAVKLDEPTQGRILGLVEACKYIGVKKATMYNLIYNKKIPAFKMQGSRVWKFDRQDLNTWISNQKQGGTNGY
jgi:excisionase family DNA binding protein